MQPTYQVPWERLENARNALISCSGGDDWFVRSALFLCGLKLSFTYWRASIEHPAEVKWAAAGHLIDDGLDETCRRAFTTLLTVAKSRDMNDLGGELLAKETNPNWLLLKWAFIKLPSKVTPAVASWLRHGDESVNWTRLSFGMGARSMWQAVPFVSKMMKGPFGFIDGNHADITKEVLQIASRFAWDRSWLLPEI